MNVVTNQDRFDCCICLTDYGPNEGIVLHNCMHILCKGCFAQYVCQVNDLIVTCPHTNAEGHKCDGTVDEREIKGVLSDSDFELYMRRCQQMSEHQLPNTFHCRSLNCSGFGIVELNDKIMICSVCRNINCIKCKVRLFALNILYPNKNLFLHTGYTSKYKL